MPNISRHFTFKVNTNISSYVEFSLNYYSPYVGKIMVLTITWALNGLSKIINHKS